MVSLIAPSVDFVRSNAFLLFLVLMFIYGIFWGAVITNSFPMLWQMSTFGTIGIYTGVYYLFSQSASILAPPITGFIIDITKAVKIRTEFQYSGIFVFASLCMLSAFFVMSKVTRGEPSDKPIEE